MRSRKSHRSAGTFEFVSMKSRIAILLTAAATLILAVLAGAYVSRLSADRSFGRNVLVQDYRRLLGQFDKTHPGRGIADYPGNAVVDIPKAYAMVLKAEIAASGDGADMGIADAAARWLLTHSDEGGHGFAGWGVPVAWDAYGDGSENPAHTKYTIATAIVIDALLDWLAFKPRLEREKTLATIRSAISPYLDDRVLSPSGLFPYSLAEADRGYDTFNPAIYLAGSIQRFSALESDAALRARMREAADKTMAVLLAHRRISPGGGWYWTYSISENVPNDLAHAGYIIRGIELYVRHGGTLASKFTPERSTRHVSEFVQPWSSRVLAWPRFRTDVDIPARSYDLGMGLYIACRESSLTSTADQMLRSIPDYRTAEGAYLKYPIGVPGSPVVIREYETYLLLGMAACARWN